MSATHSALAQVLLWVGEPVETEDVRREATAEAVRTMWTVTHGAPRTVGAVLECEGLAYALAGSVYGTITDADATRVDELVRERNSSADTGDIVAILYGDEAAEQIGWRPLGVPSAAGYRWAIDRAGRDVASRGAAAVLARE